MSRKIAFILLLICNAPLWAAEEGGSIPPNYSFYTLNPLYKENPTLGWAQQRIEEKLGRGMVAVPIGQGRVYLSWRLLKSDPESIAFNIYRSTAGEKAVKLNAEPIRKTTDFVDANAPLDCNNAWWVRPVLNGKELEAGLSPALDQNRLRRSGQAELPANPPERQYISFKLRDDIPGRGIHKVGIGDLDGDGEYDFVIKRPMGVVDPGRARKSPDTFKVEGYKNDGTFLWRNDLGWSIELGTWYSPMIVYDFDGDGKAEVALKTGEGDPRGENDRILTGPEYCSVWNGETGEEITRVDWIPRGNISDWGDHSGNRACRHMMGIAYLDGKTPSLLVIRGIYGLMRIDAWYLRDKQLHKAWSWSNQTSGWKYQGQGQHNIHVADIDGDGCDEILNGSIAIDNDGRIMWSTGLGHGDRFYVTDVDPERPGLEVWYTYEDPHPQNGVSLWDARTGDLIFGTREETGDNQVRDTFVADIDPNSPGMECWGDKFFFSAKGKNLGSDVPPQDGLVWWDADPLRELIMGGSRGGFGFGGFGRGPSSIAKYKGPTLTSGIEGMIIMMADILGDWREELITYVGGELRIYTTVIPAVDRHVCLMQDPLYRLDVAFRAMGYEQVPMTSYYLGVSPADSVNIPGAEPALEEPARLGKVTPKPLFRDPVYDGAADPAVCWNRGERKWFMFYTNRRANEPNTPGVSWVHGTRIGITESSDGGATWKYRGTADINYGKDDYTYWAPEVIDYNGTYHMFLSIVPGIFTDWNASRNIIHLTSKDMLKWKYESALKLASDRVIDACVIRLPDGTWRLWYKNERDHSWLYYADSPDLYTWTDRGVAINDQSGEGPKVFRWKNCYWLISDVWQGLAVHKSDDCQKWTRQKDNLLKEPGQSPTDRSKGQHADVLVSGDRAFLFYFTHQGGKDAQPDDPYSSRRTVIQVVELEYKDGQLTCDRDKPTHVSLLPDEDRKPK